MSKSIIGKVFFGLILIAFFHLQYTVLLRVLKQSNSLTEEIGIIKSVEKIKTPKRYFGYTYAYVITIQDTPLRFAINEYNRNAFEFIGLFDVRGNRIRLFYDKNGFNFNENLTYHVYYIEINGRELLNIDEVKKTYKIGLAIFFAADILLILMIFNAWKQKRNKTNAVEFNEFEG
jgi:hypothetical protein